MREITDIKEFSFGNAITEAKRGWFVGQFVSEAEGLRRQVAVELKWGIHPKGESRQPRWVRYRTATTISILVSGVFVLEVRAEDSARQVTLQEAGDYVIMAPGVEHTWEAVTDSVVLTVRFPSLPDDQVGSDD